MRGHHRGESAFRSRPSRISHGDRGQRSWPGV